MNKTQELTFKSLSVFIKVIDTGNMTVAAKDLGLTASAVSRRISNLEEVLDVKLIERHTKQVTPTIYGRVLYQKSIPIMEKLALLFEEVKNPMGNKNLDLRLGSSTSITNTFSPYIIPDLVDRVHSLSSYNGPTPKICGMLMSNELDIALMTQTLETEKEIYSLPLYNEDYVAIIPDEFESTVNTKHELLSLAEKLPCVQFNPSTMDAQHTTRVLRQWGITNHKISVNSIEAALRLVALGKAWSLMPTLNIWSGEKFFHGVCFKKVSPQQGKRFAYLLYKDNKYEDIAYYIKDLVQDTMMNILLPEINQKNPLLAKSISLF